MGPKAVLILGALTLTGCATVRGPSSITPICTALIGPIKYNTYVKSSKRYAGSALAPDLKQRNQVGQFLGCPKYRRF